MQPSLPFTVLVDACTSGLIVHSWYDQFVKQVKLRKQLKFIRYLYILINCVIFMLQKVSLQSTLKCKSPLGQQLPSFSVSGSNMLRCKYFREALFTATKSQEKLQLQQQKKAITK